MISGPTAEQEDPDRIILSLDIGSSGIRCLAFHQKKPDADSPPAKLLCVLEGCSSCSKTRVVEPGTGRILGLDASESSLLDRVDECVSETLCALRERYKADSPSRGFAVIGVGFSNFVMNLVGVDENGTVVTGDDGTTASITYACNSMEVSVECHRLRSVLGQERISNLYSRVGAPLHSAYALPQLRTFYTDHQTASLASRVIKWQSLSGLCLRRWLGHRDGFLPLSYSEASWTGMLDFRTCKWDDECLKLLTDTCRNALPNLSDFSDSETLKGGMSKKAGEGGNPYWGRWPELQHSRFFLGVGDGCGANIGSKCTAGSNRIATTIGTSAASRIVLTLPIAGTSSSTKAILLPPGLFCYRIDANQILVGGALTDGGSAVEWVRSLLNLSDDNDFHRCMNNVSDQYKQYLRGEADSSSQVSLTMIPFLSGERSVGFRDGATGCALGFTRNTTSADLLGSVLQGVTLRVCAILKLLQEVTSLDQAGENLRHPCIVASGTALEKNDLWRQMLADASGLSVILDAESADGTSRGIALLVAGAMSKEKSKAGPSFLFEEELLILDRSVPRECAKSHWSKGAETQENAINAVSPLWSC
uniref:Carbohydrate kinase FGGY C-terminal domain-containing protein n=1 Tax=Odontella aurita TaxID=265563 RepID=A0A7S4KBK2_9STRA|mmetsp:Transcript_8805/g.26379  ORF Transcript_8805/g.26379 Transcript_8805/m.26379 type:complete len:592 (+) Transcript_8805:424-2199(+)